MVKTILLMAPCWFYGLVTAAVVFTASKPSGGTAAFTGTPAFAAFDTRPDAECSPGRDKLIANTPGSHAQRNTQV